MSLLVGDIGGTNTRLRLVLDDASHQTIYEHTYNGTDLQHPFEYIVQENFLAQASTLSNYQQPTSACFAVAGPVVLNADGSSTLIQTNQDLILNDHELEGTLGIGSVTLINDFTAVCKGILHMSSSDYITLQTGNLDSSKPIAVIGAGTGLGQGFIIPNGDNHQIFPSEGGHSGFTPSSELEIQLFQYLRNQFDHVSAERVISGQGIMAIYQFLHEGQGFPESSVSDQILQAIQDLIAWNSSSGTTPPDPPRLISDAAHGGDPFHEIDSLSVAVMNLFVEAYAAESRNLALKLLPYGGLYIAGGIVTQNMSFFSNGQFINAFTQGGLMSDLLSNIPVHIVTTGDIGLVGAIHFG
jgi:glucokinase